MSEMLRGFVREKGAGEPCSPAPFCRTNPLIFPGIKLLPNFIFQRYIPPYYIPTYLAVLLIFPCSFHFWYSQCQVLHLRVGRSRDP